jgi:hypothetical protein
LTGLVIFVDSSTYVLTSQEYGSDNVLVETTLDHVTVKGCVFTDNTVEGLVKVLYGSQMLNVVLQALVIEHNIASHSLVEVSHSEEPSDSDINGGFRTYTKQGSRRGVKMLPRHSKLTGISIKGSYWANYAFHLVGLVDLTIGKVLVVDSGAFIGDVNAFTADAIMLDPQAYLSQAVDFGYSNAPCLGTFFVQRTYGVSVGRLELSDVTCQGCLGLTVSQGYGSVTLSDIKAIRLKSNSDQGGLLSFPEMGQATVTLSGIDVDTLTNPSGSGVAYVQQTTLKLTDSTFKNVVASLSPGLYLTSMQSVTISRVVFKSLESTNGLGAGINANFDTRQGVTFTLEDSQFTDCKAAAFKGAGLALLFSVSPLEFSMHNCEFSYNFASSGGSSVYIESTVLFTASSKISSTKFFKNTDQSQGTFTGSLASTLSIEDCEFFDNSSAEDVLYVALTKPVAVLKLLNSKLYGNTSNVTLNVQGSAKGSQLLITSCQFSKNVAVSTALLEKCAMTGDLLTLTENTGPLSLKSAKGSLFSCSFIKNTNTEQSGAVDLSDSSSFNCTKCTFSDNSAKSAGAIRVDSRSVMTLVDSVITGNSATEAGSAVYLINSRADNSIDRSIIERNTVTGSATVVLIESQLTLRNSVFRDNVGLACPGIEAQRSDVVIESSTLSSQKSTDAVFFDLQASSTGRFTKTSFRDGRSESGGGVGKVQNSSAIFVGCTFDAINSGQGSAVEAASSMITIRELTATQITSAVQGCLLQTASKSLKMSSSSVSGFNQTAISSSNMDSILISDCLFERGEAPAETVLKAVNFREVKVSGSAFRYNQAKSQIAAISLQVLSTWGANSSLEVSQSSFMHNSAASIGCIYADVQTVLIVNSTFYNNSASSDSAGAVQLDCNDPAPCALAVTSNNFSSNSAVLKGGAVYWTKQQPTFMNNSFTHNSAVYGPDIASFGVKLTSLDFADHSNLAKVSGDAYVNIGSGQRLPQTLAIALVDHAGEVVKTDNSSIASISPEDSANVTVTGSTKAFADQGVYYFKDVRFSAGPGVSINVLLSSEALASLSEDDSGYSAELLSVELQIRECQIGEAQVGKDCLQCTRGRTV